MDTICAKIKNECLLLGSTVEKNAVKLITCTIDGCNLTNINLTNINARTARLTIYKSSFAPVRYMERDL